MSTCAICGRPLTNPASIAAGVGPICGSRSYSSRIFARHGGGMNGWGGIDAWAKVNNPCFKCKHFKFPDAKQEKRVSSTSFEVSMSGCSQRFGANSIGGFCSKNKRLVDGNNIGSDTGCMGIDYEARADNNAVKGVLHSKGQQILFDFETGMSSGFIHETKSDN